MNRLICPSDLVMHWSWCAATLTLFLLLAIAPRRVFAIMLGGRKQPSRTVLVVYRWLGSFAALGVAIRIIMLLTCKPH
jgi:hypothetical protein